MLHTAVAEGCVVFARVELHFSIWQLLLMLFYTFDIQRLCAVFVRLLQHEKQHQSLEIVLQHHIRLVSGSTLAMNPKIFSTSISFLFFLTSICIVAESQHCMFFPWNRLELENADASYDPSSVSSTKSMSVMTESCRWREGVLQGYSGIFQRTVQLGK